MLSELEMLVGKVLCYLYLSPERLAQQGIFSTQEVYDELLNLADEGKLLKAVNQRSSGSDLDKQKLSEKVRAAIGRLRRLGMIHTVGEQHSGKFTISESVFRFGAEVRSGDDPLEAQARLIRDGKRPHRNLSNSKSKQKRQAILMTLMMKKVRSKLMKNLMMQENKNNV